MRRIYSFIYPLLLILLTGVICVLNYTPGTFLTGWDTLHPEFNFPQQFSNIFYGVFRSDQGLGAIAAHSHMSELPRVLFLYLESFFLPLSFLRYSYVFLCLILGPLGIYFFLTHIFKSKRFEAKTAAFGGALIYLFNLGTVQHFYVVFEMFVTQYAFIGFLFLAAVLILEKRTINRLLLLLFLSFISSSMAYAAVLWYAYFACLLCFLAAYFLQVRTKKILISVLCVVGITLAANSYWLLPNLYFVSTTASEVSLAQANRLFSDEAFLHNKEYGNIIDAAILKNFLFNWSIQLDADSSQDLLTAWKQHLSNPFVLAVGYGVFLLACIGIVLSILKRNLALIAVLPVFAISLVMLMNMNPPFDFFFGILRENFSLFKEGLRFPFTKFSIPVMFGLSVFAAYALLEILTNASKIHQFFLSKKIFIKTLYLQVGFMVIFTFLLVFYGLPFFQGELISKRIRIQIPNEYFELFSYMQTRDHNLRIAPLPVHSLWGWEYNDWGYQGAGFLWFGTPQASLSRDFDRWNPSNEQFYNEITEALYSRDVVKTETVIKKYKVGFFLLDKSVMFPGNKQNALWHYETQDTLSKSEHILPPKKFGEKLLLYEVNPAFVGSEIIQNPKNITSVGPEITGGFVDLAAQKFGDYILSDSPEYFYPARNLVNRYDRIDPKLVTPAETDTTITLSSVPRDYQFTTSWLEEDIFPEFIREYEIDSTTETTSLPYMVGQNPFISIPVSTQSASFVGVITSSESCGSQGPSTISKLTQKEGFMEFESENGSTCGYVDFPSVKQDFGSMLRLEARNISGLPLRLCVSNKLTRRCEIYTTLDKSAGWREYVFIIPPQPSGDSGYAVNLNNISIGKDTTINDIRSIRLSQIPYYRIQNLYFTNGKSSPTNTAVITSQQEINPTLYQLTATNTSQKPGLIAFYKAYSPGWKAFISTSSRPSFIQKALPFLSSRPLLNHVVVNNWANGWMIPQLQENAVIIIVFVPQFLQYAGFGILGLSVMLLFILKAILLIKGQHHTKIHRIRRIKLTRHKQDTEAT